MRTAPPAAKRGPPRRWPPAAQMRARSTWARKLKAGRAPFTISSAASTGSMAAWRSRRSRASWLTRPKSVEHEVVPFEAKPPRGLERRLGQGSGLVEVAREEGSLADHARAENVGQRHARAAGDQRLRELSRFAEVADVRVAVHRERVERDDPVVDASHGRLERPRPRAMLQCLVELPHERAVEGVHEGEPHRKGRVSSRIHWRLTGESDSASATLERAAPQELRRERNQHLGDARRTARAETRRGRAHFRRSGASTRLARHDRSAGGRRCSSPRPPTGVAPPPPRARRPGDSGRLTRAGWPRASGRAGAARPAGPPGSAGGSDRCRLASSTTVTNKWALDRWSRMAAAPSPITAVQASTDSSSSTELASMKSTTACGWR